MNRIILSFLLACITLASHGQSLTTQDSIVLFYDSLLNSLEQDYLMKEEVDWEETRAQFMSEAQAQPDFLSAMALATPLFDAIGCDHCQLFNDQAYFAATPTKEIRAEDYSEAFLVQYNAENSFEVRLLDGQYGYILIPGMSLVNKDSATAQAQRMYDAILALSQSHTVTGWIIDLRFNVGGNALPMLTGLHYLLGNGVVITDVNFNEEIQEKGTLQNGVYTFGEEVELEIGVQPGFDLTTPVAIIQGNFTASAGENILLAFQKRDHVITIGEDTYGLTSGNERFDLPMGVIAALTTSLMGTPQGQYFPYLVPGIFLERVDNFEDLMQDGNVKAAIRHFQSMAGQK